MSQTELNETLDRMYKEAWGGFISFTGTAGWYPFERIEGHKRQTQMASVLTTQKLQFHGASRDSSFWQSELFVHEYEKLLRERRVNDPYYTISAGSLYGEAWVAFPKYDVGLYMIGYHQYLRGVARIESVATSLALCGCQLNPRVA